MRKLKLIIGALCLGAAVTPAGVTLITQSALREQPDTQIICVFFVAAVLCVCLITGGWVALHSEWRKARFEKNTVAMLAGAWLIALLAQAIVIPNLIRVRTTSSANACINNLRYLDGATQQWALENSKYATNTVRLEDLAPYLGRGAAGAMPNIDIKCPEGGTYSVGLVGEKPKCSIGTGSHVLP